MLATNETRLRWLGMDMRPRWRRRVAVMITYVAAFLASVGLTNWRGYGWITPVEALFGLWLAMEFLTIFREGQLTKSFEERAYTDTERFGYRTVRKVGLKRGKAALKSHLESTMKFQLMTDAQQKEALQEAETRVEQSFPFTIPEDDSPDAPDERERAERSRAWKRTLLFLSTMLSFGAINAAMNARPWRSIDVVAYSLTLLVIARTGPKASVLWRERDPRELDGEVEMVEREA